MAQRVEALRGLGRGIDDAFARFVGVMTDLRSRLQEMDGRLDRLVRLLDGQSDRLQVLDGVEAAVAEVSGALRAAMDVANPRRIALAEDAARRALAEIADRARTLDAVATITLITAESNALGGFQDYVSDLRRLAREVGAAVVRVMALMDGLHHRRAAAGTQFRKAMAGLADVGQRLTALRDRQAETARLLSLSREGASEQAQRLPAVTARETGSLLQAMQFADAMAQRLDHAGTILARDSDLTAALARAQIDAAVTDGRAVAQTVAASLAAIRAATAEAARLLATEEKPDTEAVAQALQMGRGLLDALLAEAEMALAAIDRAATEVSPVAALADGAVGEFGAVARATVQVRLAAVNAALLSRSGGRGQEAMTVLSIEVSGQAEGCAMAAEACRRAIGDLSLPGDMAVFAGVVARTETLRVALGQTGQALAGVMAALTDVDVLRQETVEGLLALDRTGAIAEDALAQILAGFDGLATLVRTWPAEVRGTGDSAGDLMALYTMEAERAVHRRLFGMPDAARPPVASSTAPEDVLAEILF